MKKHLIILVIFLFTLTLGVFAENESKNITDDIIDEYAKLYGEQIETGIEELNNIEIEKIIPDFKVEEILTSIAKGENIFSIKEICAQGVRLLTDEVRNTMKILVIVLALSLLNTYLINLQNGLGNEISQTAFITCYAVIAGVAAAAFLEVVKGSQNLIENIAIFMRTIIPVALVSLMSSGAVISATVFETTMIGVINITEWLIEKIFLPLVMMTAALNIVNNISEKMSAEKLVGLMNKIVKWGLGILLTLFVGITGLQGIASGGADGLTVKVTRFVAANLIPVVGGILSETVETVMNCSIVIKNSIGVAGIIIVVLIAAIPIIKTTACLLLFRMCAAIAQPISDKKIVKCISELGDSISCVLSMMLTVVIMFIILLTIVINVGNSVTLMGK